MDATVSLVKAKTTKCQDPGMHAKNTDGESSHSKGKVES